MDHYYWWKKDGVFRYVVANSNNDKVNKLTDKYFLNDNSRKSLNSLNLKILQQWKKVNKI